MAIGTDWFAYTGAVTKVFAGLDAGANVFAHTGTGTLWRITEESHIKKEESHIKKNHIQRSESAQGLDY